MASADPQNGVRQVAGNQSVEGLVKMGEDGRPTPWLAERWEYSPDGRTLKVFLRPALKFHDGSVVTAETVVKVLAGALPRFMGTAFTDVEQIRAVNDLEIDIALRQHSPFVLEALELQFRSPAPASAGTGPFKPVGPSSPTELQANDQYYLGRPAIDRLAVNTYPTARAAWAEMLRDHLDMLYEVSPDALETFQRSNQIQVFTAISHYQYALIFNTKNPVLRSASVRRALSQSIDRDAFVRQGLNGHGVASAGPIWPQHWALGPGTETVAFDPAAGSRVLAEHRLHFTCLVPPDYERMALVVKRQLDQINVSMDIQEAPPDQILGAVAKRDFDAVLTDLISGPSLFRPFLWWHSGSANPSGFSGPAVDAALDSIRHAASDDDYRKGVASFQHAVIEDPPAIFLAWSQHARAVSKRFVVLDADPGRDILSTLRLWRPAAAIGRPTN
ncbi:MAG TPA: ABC transporter substrate-binding protein [Vicinamibacterales bacterium]|jgi:ABC-type transport system substrate-binding protein